jgi:hypothetical protein
VTKWPTQACIIPYHCRCEVALLILDRLENELENNVGQLTRKELEALLQWKGVSVSKMGNVSSTRILYQQFVEGGSEEASIPAPWTENDQTELDALVRNAPIKMADTSYGRFLVQQKRDAEWAYQKMSDEEKIDLKRKMAEIDVAGANDMQSATSSLTLV